MSKYSDLNRQICICIIDEMLEVAEDFEIDEFIMEDISSVKYLFVNDVHHEENIWRSIYRYLSSSRKAGLLSTELLEHTLETKALSSLAVLLITNTMDLIGMFQDAKRHYENHRWNKEQLDYHKRIEFFYEAAHKIANMLTENSNKYIDEKREQTFEAVAKVKQEFID